MGYNAHVSHVNRKNAEKKLPMPTFQQIGQDYAVRVQSAIQEDVTANRTYIKKASASKQIEPTTLPDTKLITELKRIAKESGTRWKIGNRHLTEAEQDEVYRQTGQALGMPDPGQFGLIAEGASNDAFLTLTTYINDLLPSSGWKK